MPLLLQLPAAPPQMEITDDLTSAIAEAAKLSSEDQNYLAYRIMEEIADDKKWSDSFERSLPLLDKMAADALAEHDRGETLPLEGIL